MQKKWFSLLLVLLLPIALYSGTTGKIAGVVKDKETGEPLPGANVVIVGTTLGAASDLNGGFVIINVPVGAYTVRATFIGYNNVTMSNIRVSADLTTEVNFDLSTQAIGVGEVEIIAERPLVNKNATNSTRIKTAEDIKNLPLRGFRDVIGIEAGVTKVGERLYVRGGRREEIATYIDGVYQNNPLSGRASGDVANNSIEEVNYQAGGFNAEYGFANSAVLLTTTKSGGSAYHFSGELITDEFLSATSKKLGTYSYGHNVYNFSLSGPVPGLFSKNVKFFLGGERRFLRDASPSGFAYRQLKMDAQGNPLDAQGNPITFLDPSATATNGINVNDAFPGDGRGTAGFYKPYQWDEQGPWPDRSSSQWLWNGNVTIDLKPLYFKIGGNSQREQLRLLTGFAPGADIQNTILAGGGIGFSIWDSDNNALQDNWRDSYYLKATHTLGATTFYTAQINYFRDSFVRSSVAFGDEFWNAGDAPNVDIGRFGPQGDGITNPYIRQNGSRLREDPRSADLFASLGTQPGEYWRQNWTFWGFKGDLTHQSGRQHEIKAGLEYRYNTYRNYYIGGYGSADLHSLAQNLAQVGPTFSAEQAYQNRFVDDFGYDIFGNEIEGGGRNAAKHPVIAAAYVQDKIELRDLVMNVGLRWDYFDPANDGFRDVNNVVTVRQTNGVLDLAEENFVAKKTRTNLSPRLGFSFPVTDRTVFHAQYGKFVQTPELQRLYTSTLQYAQNLQSGNFFAQENPNLAPIRTTAYELGFRHQLGDNAALDMTAYYKEVRDYVRLVNLDFARPIPYAIYLNQDYGSIKGASLTFTLRRTSRIAASANYTLQYAAGTGSDANTLYNIAWQQGRTPTFVAPLDFDQRHTGSVNIDFRTSRDDGPTFLGKKILSRTGLNLLLTFGSGLAYTPVRIQTEVLGGTAGYFPISQIGSSTGPWTYQLDLKLDKTFDLAGLNFNAYLWTINVTNALNAAYVYPGTGEVDNDGYLDTVAGRNFVQTWGPNGVELYKFLLRNPNMAGPPRQVRFGLQFNM